MRLNHDLQKETRIHLVLENQPMREVSFREAFQTAQDSGIDLVEVGSKDEVPICKILDYKKFLYEKKKNEKKPRKISTKTLKLSKNISLHDLETKTKQILSFLEDGNRVKVLLQLKGREVVYKSQSKTLLEQVLNKTKAAIEQPIKEDNNHLSMILKPA